MNRQPVLIGVILLALVFITLAVMTMRQESFLETSIYKANSQQVKTPPVGNNKMSKMPIASALKYPQPFRDTIDNSKAKGFLNQYRKIFAAKENIGDPNNPASIKTWWQAAAMIDWYVNSPLRHKCKNKVAYGNWHACQDAEVKVEPPCLVYSFGINWDFSFDDAMGKLGCEVHSFDPSMGWKDKKRSENVTFYNMGLGSINTDAYIARKDEYVKNRQVWKMRTVKRIKEMLGHENRVIDVFKMDVESYEWNVVDNMMETGVFDQIRQYMLEFHLFPTFPLKEDYVNLYNIYRRLREYGMREFAVSPHPKTLKKDKFNIQGDSEFINAKFLSQNNQ